MIECTNVYKRYKNGVNALYNINLKIDQGEFVYIIGRTGAGKSTLIRLLDGEEEPTKGTVKVIGIDVGKLRHSKVPVYRRNIGVVFQDYRLLQQKTVFENIAYALEVIGMDKNIIRSRVRGVLNLVGLDDKGSAFPGELSGGQQQRVAIARAIANRPKVLIADEPTGNLDSAAAEKIFLLFEELSNKAKTIVMVTHDSELVRMAHRILTIRDGALIRDERTERGRGGDA